MGLYTKVKGFINYTAIGSLPNINNGIASEFTSTKGLMTDTDFPYTEPWEMQIKFYNTTTSNDYIMVIGTRGFGMDFVISSRKLCIYVSSTGNSWNIASAYKGNYNVPLNEWIWVKIKKTSDYIRVFYSEDGKIWNKDIEISMNSNIKCSNGNYAKRVAIGYLNESNPHPFLGSIDLNETYIISSGNTWFGNCPVKVKVNTGLTKYTVVGNPTINNGLAYNLDWHNYISFPTVEFINNDIDYVIKYKFADGATNYRNVLLGQFGSTACQLYISYDGDLVGFYMNGSQVTLSNIRIENFTYFRFLKIGTNLTLALSNDGINWNTSVTHTDVSWKNFSGVTHLGENANNSDPNRIDYITIDLNHSYIKINGGYYWRGSHQNINAWKIQQDNFSKYYTIVDGKLMWANPNIYLQSSGTQYINTEILPSNDIEFDVKFLTNNSFDASNYGCIFGGRISSGSNDFQVTTYKGGASGTFRFGPNSTDNSYVAGIVRNQEMKTSFHNLNYSCGTANYTVNSYNFSGAKSIYLFGLNNNNSMVQSGAGCRIYYAKFKDNNIERKFIPVPKGLLIGNFVVPSNGMFDIVEQKFYSNQGTGEFEIGGIPQNYIIEGGRMIWCNSDIYLEGDGNQYINTALNINNTYYYKITAKLNDSGSSRDGAIWGSRSGAGSTDESVFWYNQGSGQPLYRFTWFGSITNLDFNKHSFEWNKNGTYLDGIQLSTTPCKNRQASAILFGLATNTTVDNRRFYGRVYNYNVLNNDNIILQYFVPVPKGMLIGDKIAPSNCMFDLVTQQFFTNQGTGDFIIGGISGDYINVGDNIVWTHENVYLQSSGTQYIDTNYMAKNTTGFYIDVQYTNTTDSVAIGSAVNLSTNNRFYVGQSGNGYYLSWNILGSERPTANTNRNIIMINYYNDRNRIYNTTTYSQCNGELAEQNSNITLFGANISNNVSYKGKMKQYNVRITNNNILIRYFLPVNTNTVIGSFTVPAPGMWDAVTRKFYPNKGTGTFTYGKDS